MEFLGRQRLPLDLIDSSNRLRPVDPAWVESLAEMMAEDGQQTPVLVRQMTGTSDKNRLIAGGHREAAARRLGWDSIEAELVECSDDEALLLEINENLARRSLTVLEEALFLAQHKDVYERLHPETKHGGDRRSQTAKFAVRSVPFSAAAASDLKKSERTIRSRVALAEALAETPGLIDELLNTAHADDATGLQLLVGMPKGKRAEAVRRLSRVDRDPPASLGAAVNEVLGLKPKPTVDPQEAIFKRLVDAWADATAATKRRFQDHQESGATRAGHRQGRG